LWRKWESLYWKLLNAVIQLPIAKVIFDFYTNRFHLDLLGMSDRLIGIPPQTDLISSKHQNADDAKRFKIFGSGPSASTS